MNTKKNNGAKGAVEVVTTPLLRGLTFNRILEYSKIIEKIEFNLAINKPSYLYDEYYPIWEIAQETIKDGKIDRTEFIRNVDNLRRRLVIKEKYILPSRIRTLFMERGSLLVPLYDAAPDAEMFTSFLTKQIEMSIHELTLTYEFFKIIDKIRLSGFWGPVFAKFFAITYDWWKIYTDDEKICGIDPRIIIDKINSYIAKTGLTEEIIRDFMDNFEFNAINLRFPFQGLFRPAHGTLAQLYPEYKKVNDPDQDFDFENAIRKMYKRLNFVRTLQVEREPYNLPCKFMKEMSKEETFTEFMEAVLADDSNQSIANIYERLVTEHGYSMDTAKKVVEFFIELSKDIAIVKANMDVLVGVLPFVFKAMRNVYEKNNVNEG